MPPTRSGSPTLTIRTAFKNCQLPGGYVPYEFSQPITAHKSDHPAVDLIYEFHPTKCLPRRK